MENTTHQNRHGDISTFTKLKDGNIQWTGDFDFCSMAFANDYTRAWAYFKEVYGGLEYYQFVEEVYRYDDLKFEYVFPDVVPLIDTTDIIDMVDPHGGPYTTVGDVIMGKTVLSFEKNNEGYLIITE